MTVSAASPKSVTTLPNRIEAIRNVIRSEYLETHHYPLLVAYSGGKDSTLLLQLVWEIVADLPPEARRRRVLGVVRGMD